MAYGPRSRSGYKSRSSNYRKFTRSNRSKAVATARGKTKRILRRPFVPRILKNTQSVASLSRSVQRLQQQALGLYQKCRHGYQNPGSDTTFTDSRPILFALNDFAHDASIWTCDANGSAVIKGAFSEWQYPMGNNQDFNYWEGTFNDAVSNIAYLPISTQLEFNFESNMRVSDQPIWIRIDIVRQKKFFRQTSAHELVLPNALYGLSKMAVTKTPNQYNREYFEVIKTKWVKLDRATGTDTNQMNIQKRVKMSYTFKPKLLKIDRDLDEPTADHTWLTNVQPKNMIWAVVNSSQAAISGMPNLQMYLVRTCRWRDQHGVSS